MGRRSVVTGDEFLLPITDPEAEEKEHDKRYCNVKISYIIK